MIAKNSLALFEESLHQLIEESIYEEEKDASASPVVRGSRDLQRRSGIARRAEMGDVNDEP
jgi:hypothetical protein